MKILWTKKQEDEFITEVLLEFREALREVALKVQAKAEPQVDIPLPPPPEDKPYEFKGYL